VFSPPLPTHDTVEDGQDSIMPFLRARYSKAIPVLAPGSQLSNVYTYGIPGHENLEAVEDVVVARVAYADNDRAHTYEDDFPLDLRVIRTGTTSTGSNSPEGQAKEAVKILKRMGEAAAEINRTLRALTGDAPEPTRGLPPQLLAQLLGGSSKDGLPLSSPTEGDGLPSDVDGPGEGDPEVREEGAR